jgi:hypothetical protein
MIIKRVLILATLKRNTLMFRTIVEMERIKEIIVKNQRSSREFPLKQIRMVANLPKLHDQIHQILNLILILRQLKKSLQRNFSSNFLIQNFLPWSQIAKNFMLKLLTEFLFDILFDPSKHKRL